MCICMSCQGQVGCLCGCRHPGDGFLPFKKTLLILRYTRLHMCSNALTLKGCVPCVDPYQQAKCVAQCERDRLPTPGFSDVQSHHPTVTLICSTLNDPLDQGKWKVVLSRYCGGRWSHLLGEAEFARATDSHTEPVLLSGSLYSQVQMDGSQLSKWKSQPSSQN